MNLRTLRIQIFQADVSLRAYLFRSSGRPGAGHAIEPADGGVVVVCPGIGHDVAVIVVRQIDTFCIAAKSELQDAHPGKAKAVAQPLDIRSDHAQVFGDDRQFAERLVDRREQFPSRRFDPASVFRSGVASRDLPTSCKPAEVIDAGDVDDLQAGPHALNPPAKTVLQHPLPVVERITPELSSGAEIIRRYAGHDYRPAVSIELELV